MNHKIFKVFYDLFCMYSMNQGIYFHAKPGSVEQKAMGIDKKEIGFLMATFAGKKATSRYSTDVMQWKQACECARQTALRQQIAFKWSNMVLFMVVY